MHCFNLAGITTRFNPCVNSFACSNSNRRAECRNKFQQYDVDGNGYISTDEAYTVLSKELGFTSQKTKKMLQQFDINKDGKLSYEEFVGFYAKIQQK